MTRRRLPLYPALAAVAAAALAGCANPLADQALIAQSALIGMPKQTLLSCAGVPPLSTTADGFEYFTYDSNRLVSYPRPGFGYPWGYPWRPWYGYPGWYDWDYGGVEVYQYSCEATFTLKNGMVQQVTYRGGSSLSQCYTIVENCLAAVPQKPGSASQGPTGSPQPAPPP